LLGQFAQPHSLTTEAVRQYFCALHGAIRDSDAFRVLGSEVSDAQINHLTGANEQRMLLRGIIKDAL
jgi:hypothetical protein